jgi:hypothetical protein
MTISAITLPEQPYEQLLLFTFILKMMPMRLKNIRGTRYLQSIQPQAEGAPEIDILIAQVRHLFHQTLSMGGCG